MDNKYIKNMADKNSLFFLKGDIIKHEILIVLSKLYNFL
jgi:hypothetical protein